MGPGSEMARHAEVTAALGTLVYFCDPASPWLRTSNENATGLLRQYFRKGVDLSTVEPADVRFAADEINGRPRAVLAWDSATVRFASLEADAALHDSAGLGATEGTLPLPTTGVLLGVPFGELIGPVSRTRSTTALRHGG